MKCLIIIIAICFSPIFLFSQIELNVNKVSQDSFNIFFTKKPDLQMNKPYKFIIKTNIKKKDSIILGICRSKGFLENNLEFIYTFTYYFYPLTIERKTSSGSKFFFDAFRIDSIKGIKYILKIDGKQYYRHKGGRFGPNSIFTIDFISDLYDMKNIEIRDPVYFSVWFRKKNGDSIYLKNNHLSFRIKNTDEISLLKQKKMLFIVFPQVYYKGVPVLSEKDSERMAIVYYEKNIKN